MSSFTTPLIVKAVPTIAKGWARLFPPGFQRPRWEITKEFLYLVGDYETPSAIVAVPSGFQFDGASVPLLFRVLVPMAHPNYIQAAALHDWMLASKQYSRRYCDRVFYEALGVLNMHQLWRWVMFAAVRIGAYKRFCEKLLSGKN